jgi:WD40 repeat protein
VTCFTVLLGLVFLPQEASRFWPRKHISITHVVVPTGDEPSAALYWSIPESGSLGWRHHLSIGGVELNVVPPGASRRLEPLSMARIGSSSEILVGNWDGSLYRCDLMANSRGLVWVGSQSDGGVMDVACGLDGKYAISYNAFGVYGWDLLQNREVWRRRDLRASCVVAGPQRGSALVCDFEGGLEELDLTSGQTLRLRPKLAAPAVAAAMFADDQRLALLTTDGALRLLEWHTGRPLWTRSSGWQIDSGRWIAFSPCGNVLVTTDAENPCGLALYATADGRQLLRIRGHEGLVLGATFAADGTLWSWGADGTIRTWVATTGQALKSTRLGLNSAAT